MEKKFAEIINEGKKQGAPVEAINAELKAAGAKFHLDYTTTPDGPQTGWREAEMEEGFLPAAEGEVEVPKRLHDYMRYNPEMAGQTIRFQVPEGTYDVTWDEGGHPEKAVRVHD